MLALAVENEMALVATTARPFTACIITHSGLANQYLQQAMAASSSFDSIPLDEFVSSSRDSELTIFILDASSLRLPLGECLRRLHVRYATAKYLVIGKVRSVPDLARLLLLGVHGYLDEGDTAGRLTEAALAVLEGGYWVAPAVLQQYVTLTTASNRMMKATVYALTQREVEIHELLQQRYSTKEIARMFNLQESTVKFHLTNIFGKLRVSTRRELLDLRIPDDVWERLL